MASWGVPDAARTGDTFGRDPGTVAASWALALDRLAATDPAALQMVSFLAWLAPEPAPRTLFTTDPELFPDPLGTAVRDPLRVVDMIRLLRRRSVTRVIADGRGCIACRPTA